MLALRVHLILFTRESLGLALRRAGFRHVQVEASGDSLLAYASDRPLRFRRRRGRTPSPGLSALPRNPDGPRRTRPCRSGTAPPGGCSRCSPAPPNSRPCTRCSPASRQPGASRFGIDLVRLRLPDLLPEPRRSRRGSRRRARRAPAAEPARRAARPRPDGAAHAGPHARSRARLRPPRLPPCRADPAHPAGREHDRSRSQAHRHPRPHADHRLPGRAGAGGGGRAAARVSPRPRPATCTTASTRSRTRWSLGIAPWFASHVRRRPLRRGAPARTLDAGSRPALPCARRPTRAPLPCPLHRRRAAPDRWPGPATPRSRRSSAWRRKPAPGWARRTRSPATSSASPRSTSASPPPGSHPHDRPGHAAVRRRSDAGRPAQLGRVREPDLGRRGGRAHARSRRRRAGRHGRARSSACPARWASPAASAPRCRMPRPGPGILVMGASRHRPPGRHAGRAAVPARGRPRPMVRASRT